MKIKTNGGLIDVDGWPFTYLEREYFLAIIPKGTIGGELGLDAWLTITEPKTGMRIFKFDECRFVGMEQAKEAINKLILKYGKEKFHQMLDEQIAKHKEQK